jgi:hypothetical protein
VKQIKLFIQKMPSSHRALFTISNPKKGWWPSNVFGNFQSKKCLAIARHFLKFPIQKTPSNYQVFSMISS